MNELLFSNAPSPLRRSQRPPHSARCLASLTCSARRHRHGFENPPPQPQRAFKRALNTLNVPSPPALSKPSNAPITSSTCPQRCALNTLYRAPSMLSKCALTRPQTRSQGALKWLSTPPQTCALKTLKRAPSTPSNACPSTPSRGK